MSQAVSLKLSSAGPRNGEMWYTSVFWAWSAPRMCVSCVLQIWVQVHIAPKVLLGAQGCSQRQALHVPTSVHWKWHGRGWQPFTNSFAIAIAQRGRTSSSSPAMVPLKASARQQYGPWWAHSNRAIISWLIPPWFAPVSPDWAVLGDPGHCAPHAQPGQLVGGSRGGGWQLSRSLSRAGSSGCLWHGSKCVQEPFSSEERKARVHCCFLSWRG